MFIIQGKTPQSQQIVSLPLRCFQYKKIKSHPSMTIHVNLDEQKDQQQDTMDQALPVKSSIDFQKHKGILL